VALVSGVRMQSAWVALDESGVGAVGGYMGVYEIASPDGEVVKIGFAGGRSVFGLRGELQAELAEPDRLGASFRCEITTAYLSRYKELLMVHVADHGALPMENAFEDVGRLSPG
jgi:hypothetical protein